MIPPDPAVNATVDDSDIYFGLQVAVNKGPVCSLKVIYGSIFNDSE